MRSRFPILVITLALLLGSTASAQCPSDDAFEDNDSCSAAATITPGSYGSLQGHFFDSGAGDDEDYYRLFGLLHGQTIDVDIFFIDAGGDFDLHLYTGTTSPCFSQVDLSRSTNDDESVTYTNTTGAAQDVAIWVETFGSAGDDGCNDYSMDVILSDPICGGPDDPFENNDSCGAASTALSIGSSSALQVHGPASGGGVDADFFEVVVAAAERLDADAFFTHISEGDVDLFLYDDAGICGSLVASATSADDNESLAWENLTGSSVTVTLEVRLSGAGAQCNDYDLLVTLGPAGCLLADDSFEENDDCTMLALITPGAYTDLVVYGEAAASHDEDYYQIAVPDGDRMSVDCFFSNAEGDIQLRVYEDPGWCGEIVAEATLHTDDEHLFVDNLSGSPVSLVIRVYPFGSGFDCNQYDMDVTVAQSPCVVDDALEDNDTCAAATTITTGLYTGLVNVDGDPDDTNLLGDPDPDYFRMTIGASETVTVEVYFDDDEMDMDMRLTMDSSCTTWDEFGVSTSDDEQVIFTNTTGGALEVRWVVYSWINGTTGACADYDMSVSVSGPSTGVPFCFGDGSDGAICPCGNYTSFGIQPAGCDHTQDGSNDGGYLEASGTASVADDTDGTPSMMLTVRDAYPNEFGMFVSGTSFTPFGAIGTNGFLCIAADGDLNRYFAAPAAPFPLNSFGDGDNVSAGFSMAAADNANLPATTTAGATIWYQFWFRDNPGGGGGACSTGSNLTAGIRLTWSA